MPVCLKHLFIRETQFYQLLCAAHQTVHISRQPQLGPTIHPSSPPARERPVPCLASRSLHPQICGVPQHLLLQTLSAVSLRFNNLIHSWSFNQRQKGSWVHSSSSSNNQLCGEQWSRVEAGESRKWGATESCPPLYITCKAQVQWCLSAQSSTNRYKVFAG